MTFALNRVKQIPKRIYRQLEIDSSISKAATAHFDEHEGELFSIVLRFPVQKEQIENGATSVVDIVKVDFLAPELASLH